MTDLGRIALRDQASIFDARRKVRALASALGFPPVEATRPCSFTSLQPPAPSRLMA